MTKKDLKIKRPDWETITTELMSYGGRHCTKQTAELLDKWFYREVEPLNRLIDEGVEVTGCECDSGHAFSSWKPAIEELSGLVIAIKPIKEKSIEEKNDT